MLKSLKIAKIDKIDDFIIWYLTNFLKWMFILEIVVKMSDKK